MNADRFLRCRVPEQVRVRFDALAHDRGETQSSLLRRLIDQALADACESSTSRGAEQGAPDRRSDRVTVRMRPGDGHRLRLRAEARATRPATYLAMLVRAHLHADAPLPEAELIQVKQVLSEIASVARALRVESGSDANGKRFERTELEEALVRVEQARGAIASLVQASVTSWESDLA
jgi:hypothetical protein